jgi:hypothetical protein
VNANPLVASIFDEATGGAVKHETVKKDIDCIIAEVDIDGTCVYVLTHSCIFTPPLAALIHDFPFPLLFVTSFVHHHREYEFLRQKICVFHSDTFTIWVAQKHGVKLKKATVEKARAVTENSNAPCVARKEVAIERQAAYELLRKCEVMRMTVMQYGQKAELDNKVVEWALKNVRGSE